MTLVFSLLHEVLLLGLSQTLLHLGRVRDLVLGKRHVDEVLPAVSVHHAVLHVSGRRVVQAIATTLLVIPEIIRSVLFAQRALINEAVFSS